MLKPNGLAGFHKDWIILQLIFVCTLAQHEKQQDLWLGRRAGSFRPALFKDFLKENRCGKPAWERWGRRKRVSKERGCSLPPPRRVWTAGPSPGHFGGHQGWIWSMWVSSRALRHSLPCFSGALLGWKGLLSEERILFDNPRAHMQTQSSSAEQMISWGESKNNRVNEQT